jgi:hypothetical protein
MFEWEIQILKKVSGVQHYVHVRSHSARIVAPPDPLRAFAIGEGNTVHYFKRITKPWEFK